MIERQKWACIKIIRYRQRHVREDEHLTENIWLKCLQSVRLWTVYRQWKKKFRDIHSFIGLEMQLIEQTTTFHACSVSKLMLILIDKTKKRIVQVKLQWKNKNRKRNKKKLVPLDEQMTDEYFPR